MSQYIVTTAPADKTKRIRAFDIIRGLFMLVILVDHIELYPSFFDFFTGRGRLFVSAAEGFFFMSGLLLGIVYKRRLHLGTIFVFKKMWRRAFELYLASIFFTLFYTALATYLKHPGIKDGLGDTTNWPHIIKETVLMRYGYGWADFLDRFAILMIFAPFGFYLLSRRKWWILLATSFAAWCLRSDNFTLSWQFLFLGAMMIGYYWNEMQSKINSWKPENKRRLKLGLSVFTVVTFSFSYACVFLLSKLNQNLLGDPWILPQWLQHLTIHWNNINNFIWLYAQKWTLGPVRIVLFLAWFSSLFLLVQRYEDTINKYTRGVVEVIGRNSLFVYILHSLIVFGFKFFIPTKTNIFQNFFITGAALALLIIITLYYQRFNENRKTASAKAKTAKIRYRHSTETAN